MFRLIDEERSYSQGFGLPMVEDPDHIHGHQLATCTGCHAGQGPNSSIGY